MNTSEILNKAADLIEQRGWTTGVTGWDSGGENTGPICLEGGIEAASGVSRFDGDYGDYLNCPAFAAVQSYLSPSDPDAMPWQFNDAPGRTASEVIEVLRATAVIEAAREDQDAAFATYAGQVSA